MRWEFAVKPSRSGLATSNSQILPIPYVLPMRCPPPLDHGLPDIMMDRTTCRGFAHRRSFMTAAANTPNPWPTALTDSARGHPSPRRRNLRPQRQKFPVTTWKTGLKPNRKSCANPRSPVTTLRSPSRRRRQSQRSRSMSANTTSHLADGYRPGEFGSGASVLVRFHGDKCSCPTPQRQGSRDHHRQANRPRSARQKRLPETAQRKKPG